LQRACKSGRGKTYRSGWGEGEKVSGFKGGGRRRRKSRRAKRKCRESASSKMGSGIELEAKVHGAWYRVSDILSSYFLCSNNSKRTPMRRKLIRGMGMHGNLVRENGVCGKLG